MAETLGEAWREGWKLRIVCAAGQRARIKSIREWVSSREIDMETLVWAKGRAFPIVMLGQRLRCPRCGSLQIRVLFEPPNNRTAPAAASANWWDRARRF